MGFMNDEHEFIHTKYSQNAKPAIGFKLTDDGNYDIDGKILFNARTNVDANEDDAYDTIKKDYQSVPNNTVAHNCHGKRKNLAAKRKASRQKEIPRGKKKSLTAKRKTSRQKEKPHGKKKNPAAKRKTSRQKEKLCGKKNINLTAKRKLLTAKRKTSRRKEKPHGKKKNLAAKRKRELGGWVEFTLPVAHMQDEEEFKRIMLLAFCKGQAFAKT